MVGAFSQYSVTLTDLPIILPSDRHELSLLVVRPLQGEEQFNQSRILKTQLEDLVENRASNPSFTVSSR